MNLHAKKKTKSIIETLIRFKYQLCVFMFIENFLQNKWNNIWFVKNASRYNSRNFFYSSIIWFLIKWKVFFFRNFETQSHRMRDPGIFVNSFGPSVQKKEKLCRYLVNVVGLSKWISTIIDCVLTECLNISLAISMDDLWSGTRLKIEKCKWKISCFQKSYSIFTFGCIKTNGNSAETSPPSAPKKSLTLTAYETMIPNASRFSGVARLQKKKKQKSTKCSVRIQLIQFKLTVLSKPSCFLHVSLVHPMQYPCDSDYCSTMAPNTWSFAYLSLDLLGILHLSQPMQPYYDIVHFGIEQHQHLVESLLWFF